MSSFAAIVVELPPIPSGAEEAEDDLLEALREALEGGLMARLFRAQEGLDELLRSGHRALHAAKARRQALEDYGDSTLRALGQAWLDSGAPGRPQVVEQIEVRLETERERFQGEFSSLMDERDLALLEAEARGQVAHRQQETLLQQLERMEGVLDHLQAGLRACSTAGLFVALDVLERLPDPLKAGIPRTDLGALQRWATALHDRLRVQQEELELRIAMARTREVQALSQEVHVDKAALDKALAIQQARGRTAEELTQFLMGVGRKLVPMAHSFANGAQAVATLKAARALHAATAERVTELEELLAALQDRGRGA